MAKFTTTQNSFSSGELSPLLKGRTSLAQYGNGCETLENFIVLPQGGAMKRPGTQFITEVKNSANTTRLIPFIVSEDQSYVLEFGDYYVRFYRDGGVLLSTGSAPDPNTRIDNGAFTTTSGTIPTSWTDTSSGTGTASGITNYGRITLAGGSSGVGQVTQQISSVLNATYRVYCDVFTNTVTYKIGTTSGASDVATGTLTAGLEKSFTFNRGSAGNVFISFSNPNNNSASVDNARLEPPVLEVATPWSKDMVADLQYAQSKDVMYIAHSNVPLYKLTRTGVAAWTLVAVDLVDGPYYSRTHETYSGIGSGISIHPSGVTGSVTVTSSAALFASTDVGRRLRFRHNSTSAWGEMIITAYTSSTSVTATVQRALSAASSSQEWRLGALSQTTGYAKCVAFHEQRLVLANTSSQPQTIWFSRSADIEVFQPDNDEFKDEVDATSGMTYTVASKDTNDITWLSSRTVLYLGTRGAIFVAKASALDEALTPTNISIRPAVRTASHNSLPLEVTNATLFIHYHQRKLMELAYNAEQDSMVTVDLSLLSEHLGRAKLTEIVRQEEPYNIIWARDEVGGLYGLTYLREQSVTGWHRHYIGGSGKVLSMCCVPGTEYSELWMVIERTINNKTKRYIERLSRFFTDDIDAQDATFLDSYLTYSGGAVSTISGIDHLENKQVKVYTNGNVGSISTYTNDGEDPELEEDTPLQVVRASRITITDPTTTTKAHVGLSYTCKLKTMPIVQESQGGTSQGALIRIFKALVRFHRSALARVGQQQDNVNIIENFADRYIMGGELPLVSTVKEVYLEGGAELETATYIEQDAPAPMIILAVTTKVFTDDDR